MDLSSNEIDAAAILEKDTNGDHLWTWTYPSITLSQRDFVKTKIQYAAQSIDPAPFFYTQWRRQWYYIVTSPVDDNDNLPKMVTEVSLLITAKDFNPERYAGLCNIFLKSYKRTGTPSAMLQSYLSIFTRGRCMSDSNGTFVMKDFTSHMAYSFGDINGIINSFGIETILLYTAMLLKKRVVVYHTNLPSLLDFIRVIPSFAWHRQNWTILYPFVDMNEEELNELNNSSSYVAGFVCGDIENREDLYDIFVNVPNNEIAIASHAKDAFAMGKLHKDMAKFIMQCADSESCTTIEDIATKTRDLLNNLSSLCHPDESGKLHIRLEDLKARKMPLSTENFLYRLAVCEGLVKL